MNKTATDYRIELDLPYAPSQYQVNIWDCIESGRGHAVVEAVAGSGKTETIVRAAQLLTSDGLFMAFNKVIADMLGERLAGTSMTASTIHSHGFAAIRAECGRVGVDSSKYSNRIKDLAKNAIEYGILALGRDRRDLLPAELSVIDEDGFPIREIGKLLDLARLNLLDPRVESFSDDLMNLADHHNIDTNSLPDLIIQSVGKLMTWGWDHVETVDFTDMVWLPTVNGYTPRKYAWVFIDECQDITRAALALIRRSVQQGGRMLFVGDRRQSIYGFMGADADSFQNIVESTEATVLPLSVCYRCPTAVLDLARAYCPQIEAREGAPEGIVRRSTVDDFIGEAREGDMVLCRLNAPLISICFGLIAEGISAAVRGRDIGAGLAKTIKKCAKGLADFGMFSEALSQWVDDQCDFARTRYDDADALAARVEAIGDQAECIRIILARSKATSVHELVRAVEDLFSDGTPSVVLSSVHRAKGLEAPRVFIAKPERLGVARANAKQWMLDQEDNLAYVAYSRAQLELVFLDSIPGSDKAPKLALPAATEPATNDEKYAAASAAYDSGDKATCVTHLTSMTREQTWSGPAPLPAVDSDAPEVYDTNSRAAHIALARQLDRSLRELGFAPVRVSGASEVVYGRTIKPGLEQLVYSTIVNGAVRGCGKDAIRVCLVDSKGARVRGAGSAKRVNRVGTIAGILERVVGRVAAQSKVPLGSGPDIGPEVMREVMDQAAS